MRSRALGFVLLALLLAAGGARAVEVRLRGERLSLRSKQEPLTAFLKQLAHAGVRVRVDPQAEARVTADFENEDLQKALAAVLEPFGYVLIWDVIEGPLGPVQKLAEVQVYMPGREKSLQPLAGVDPNLAVATGAAPGGPEFVADEILISFKPGTSQEDVWLLLGQIGGTLVEGIPELGIYQVRLAPGSNIPALVEQLAGKPIVAHVEPNYVLRPPEPSSAPADAIPEPGRLEKPAKDAVSVAVLDSGLRAQPALTNAIVGAYDALDPGRAIADPVGHGTQMAMIAAGAVVPAAAGGEADSLPVVAVRAFDDRGVTSNFGLMRGLAYALGQGARVVNMSWGTETKSDFLETAVRYAQSKNTLMVAAAGNEPTGRAVYPAALSGVVAVSALGADGRAWDSSNYGDFVTVSAPGTAVFPVGYRGAPGSYAGTSIASAYTARTLALYFTQHPAATPKDALKALKAAVTDAGPAGRDARYGYGVLDAAAVQRLLSQ